MYSTVETYVESGSQASAIARRVMLNVPNAPCAHIEEVRSVFRWDGQVKDIPEWRVSFDVPDDLVESVVAIIEKEHPYDLPGTTIRHFEPATKGIAEWLDDPERF